MENQVRPAVEQESSVQADRKSLVAQIEEKRAQLVATLFEAEDISLQINPRIEADYAVKVGYLETELFQAQLAARRAKRRLTLAQAQVNAGEAVNESACEAKLDEEFAEWEAVLVAKTEAYFEAVERRLGSKTLSRTDSREIKSLHRTLVRRLHPDLHAGQSAEEQAMFFMAQGAYERGDLAVLRSLESITRGMDEQSPSSEASVSELHIELELVEAQLRVAESQLAGLKASNPYALKDLLEDAMWVAKRCAQLREQIEEQVRAKRSFDERFAELKGAGCGERNDV